MRPFALRIVLVASAVLGSAALITATPAPAQTPTTTPAPSPARSPTVTGEIRGALTARSTLTLRVDATMPGGWEGLHLVEAAVVSGERELEALRFDIEDDQLTVGDQEIVVGTGAVAIGTYLRVPGSRVVVTTGGANMSFQATAEVLRAIPPDARFVLSVTDDLGASATVTRRLAAPPDEGGLTWGTVVTLIAAALFAGGFVGNLFASRRRPAARPSVYTAVQRRIETDRAARAPTDPR